MMKQASDNPIESAWPKIKWIIAIAITTITLAMSLYFYRELPETMPIHFDGRGVPDGFASKNSGAFLGIICQLIMIVIFGLAYYALGRPEKDRESKHFSLWKELPAEAVTQIIPKVTVFMDGMFLSLLLMFLYLQYVTDMVALERRQQIGIGIWVFVAFLLIWGTAWTVFFILKGSRLKK